MPSARTFYTRFVVFWVLACAALLLVSAVMRSPFKVASKRAVCQNNEKNVGLVFRIYTAEHGGWPTLSPEAGVLQPDWRALNAEHTSFWETLVCPSDSDVDKASVADGRSPGSYYYLGYIVRNEKELKAFGAAYRQRIAEGGSFDEDLPIPAEYGGGVVRRLSESAIAELAQEPGGADIPVLFERSENHVPKGMNVLYADGHVAFVKFGERFPATQHVVDYLDEMENRGR